MQICTSCKTEYDDDEKECPHCGVTNLNRPFGSETVRLDRNFLNQMLESLNAIKALLKSDDTLILKFGKSQLQVSLTHKIILGRDMSALGGDLVDLERFTGQKAGISRRHAEMVCTATGEVALTDLASSNGTFINGERLTPLRQYPVQDGDEIAFGTLKMMFAFDED